MNSQLVVGQEVVQKGKSWPVMTVSQLIGDKVVCRWFNKGKQERSEFAAAELSPPPPPPKPMGVMF